MANNAFNQAQSWLGEQAKNYERRKATINVYNRPNIPGSAQAAGEAYRLQNNPTPYEVLTGANARMARDLAEQPVLSNPVTGAPLPDVYRNPPADRMGNLARTYTNMAYVEYAMNMLANIPAEDLRIEDFPLVIRPETALALGLDDSFLAELGYSNNNQYGYWVRPTASTNTAAGGGGGGSLQQSYGGYGGYGGGGWGNGGGGGGYGYDPYGVQTIFGNEMGPVTWRI